MASRVRFILSSPFLFVGLFAALPVFADTGALTEKDCSQTVNMSDPGGSMEHVTARDQHTLSICWSEAESAVADAMRFSVFHEKNYDFQTSAVATACGVSAEKNDINTLAEGGESCWAFDYMKKNGICSEQQVEDGTLAVTQAGISRFADATRRSSLLQLSASQVARYRPLSTQTPGCPDTAGESVERKVVPDQRVMKALLNATYNAPQEFHSVTRNCSPRPPLNSVESPFEHYNISCTEYPSQESQRPSPAVFAHKLNDLLNTPHPLPIEVDYCSAIFDEGGRKSSVVEVNSLRSSSPSCKGHASLVIGKRWEGGKCEFLIRNSWGTDCDQYSKAMRGGCDGKGSIWVDSDLLTNNTMQLVPPPVLTPMVKP
jgi:hypothetical protein